MHISIWIVFAVITAIGFLFVYKKNKHKIIQTPHEEKNIKKKYALTDLDKMLNHVTSTKKTEEAEENKNTENIDDPIEESSKEKIEEKTQNIKNSVLGSIILERKKKT